MFCVVAGGHESNDKRQIRANSNLIIYECKGVHKKCNSVCQNWGLNAMLTKSHEVQIKEKGLDFWEGVSYFKMAMKCMIIRIIWLSLLSR